MGRRNKLIIGTIASMTMFIVADIQLVHPQPSVNMTRSPQEIKDLAIQFIVKIDGSSQGTGIILQRKGRQYTVLTNKHVVENSRNNYITTLDKYPHPISQVKQLPNADLAVVYFTSDIEYPVAVNSFGDSDKLKVGQKIYLLGYSASRENGDRVEYWFPSNINAIDDKENGYRIIFSGGSRRGMSGSPILDENAKIIGIYGRFAPENASGSSLSAAIPINLAVKLMSKDINISPEVNTVQNPPLTIPNNLPTSWQSNDQTTVISKLGNLCFGTTDLESVQTVFENVTYKGRLTLNSPKTEGCTSRDTLSGVFELQGGKNRCVGNFRLTWWEDNYKDAYITWDIINSNDSEGNCPVKRTNWDVQLSPVTKANSGFHMSSSFAGTTE